LSGSPKRLPRASEKKVIYSGVDYQMGKLIYTHDRESVT
jgi:hypothetical protein